MTSNPHTYRTLLITTLLLLTFFAVFYVSLVGVIGSDDQVYIENARSRIYDPFMVGTDHWAVRLILTIPMAFAFTILGESELSSALPTLLYMFLTGIIVFIFLVERVALGTSVLIATLIATNPLLVINATSLGVDSVENFFVISSLMLFCHFLKEIDIGYF